MALEAQLVHLVALQHPRIETAMRLVADLTIIGFDRSVGEDEGPFLVGVAGRTTILRHHLETSKRLPGILVRVVAVDALHPSFQDRVMKGLPECRFSRPVALHAKGYGFGSKQAERALLGVDHVAVPAFDLVLTVR